MDWLRSDASVSHRWFWRPATQMPAFWPFPYFIVEMVLSPTSENRLSQSRRKTKLLPNDVESWIWEEAVKQWRLCCTISLLHIEIQQISILTVNKDCNHLPIPAHYYPLIQVAIDPCVVVRIPLALSVCYDGRNVPAHWIYNLNIRALHDSLHVALYSVIG